MSATNKTTLLRRIQDANISPSERSQLESLVSAAPDTPESLEALERRLNAALGGVTKSYNTKVPGTIQTK